MEFSFFTTDNKSGYKTTAKWFSKNYPEEYSKIITYPPNINIETSFKEKIWFYYNKLIKRPECKTCGNEIKFRERFDVPYGEFCSLNCINENKDEMTKRQKKTFQKKYGIDFYPQHKDFMDKQKKTKLERYGDENYNNLRKNKETKLIRYGDEKYCNHSSYEKTCIEKYGIKNFSKTTLFSDIINEKFKQIYEQLKIKNVNKNELEIFCEKCNENYRILKHQLFGRLKCETELCTICNPIGQAQRSGHEKKLSEFLTLLDVEHIPSYRKLKNGKEIDIFIPHSNLGIEIDGLYWHNELFTDPDYHLKKTNECRKQEIDLIHIFEDEWIQKNEIIKSIIKNRLGITKNVIYARKCVIKELDTKTSSYFLNQNHIQGNVNSKVRLGLYYNDTLVSVMTFSMGRIIMGGKKDEWELTRFVNLINTNVVGAASKLFKHFIKVYNPNKIVSYSDIRLFKGGMYEKLGFKYISQSKPNYWYVINGFRYHRFNFRKGVLIKEGFDVNKTEREIMFDRKIYRIYDCGNIRWEYSN